jgi:hypothetical protein
MVAAKHGNVIVFNCLVALGAQSTGKDQQGFGILTLACLSVCSDCSPKHFATDKFLSLSRSIIEHLIRPRLYREVWRWLLHYKSFKSRFDPSIWMLTAVLRST